MGSRTAIAPLAPPVMPTKSTASRSLSGATTIDARLWFSLAIGSLVIAGLLSLAVVLGRLPFLSRIIDDPLFFKRCLVVHVDLALVVWFYAFLAGLLALATASATNALRNLAWLLATGGVVAMLAGGLVRGTQPILANYVPVIDHPVFHAGLATFFLGTLLFFLLGTFAPAEDNALPADAFMGLRAATALTTIAAATWVSARAGLPDGVDAYTRAEFLAWGPGHVLQAANAAAMLAVWFWLLRKSTNRTVLSSRSSGFIFALLVLPQAAMPLLTARGTLDTLYHSGATQLMRWGIFPAMLIALVAGIAHLRRHVEISSESGKVALTGFAASAGLATLGVVLGACIRGSTTLVPAHYHASLGAVTVAFMAAAYFVCDHLAQRQGSDRLSASLWKSARWQLATFGIGQAVFALGFGIGGAYGLGRKAYAAEQHVRSAGELTGLIVMAAGGLVAVAGGLWFLFLMLRQMRAWWQRTPATRHEFSILHTP